MNKAEWTFSERLDGIMSRMVQKVWPVLRRYTAREQMKKEN